MNRDLVHKSTTDVSTSDRNKYMLPCWDGTSNELPFDGTGHRDEFLAPGTPKQCTVETTDDTKDIESKKSQTDRNRSWKVRSFVRLLSRNDFHLHRTKQKKKNDDVVRYLCG